MFAKAHGRNHDQDIITDRSEVGIRRVVEGHERMGKTIEPVILTMAGGRFSVWSLVNGAQHSPSRVKSGPGAACYASRWDVAPGGPDRARSCHWPPLTPPRTTHCSTCPPCRLVPRVTDVETGHFSRGSTVISIRSFRPLHPKIRSISITISTEQFHQMFVSFLFYFVRFFFQFFEDPFGVGEKFLWILIESLIGLKNKSWIRWLVSNFLRLSHHFSIVINCVKCYRISSFNNVKSRSIFLSTTTTT